MGSKEYKCFMQLSIEKCKVMRSGNLNKERIYFLNSYIKNNEQKRDCRERSNRNLYSGYGNNINGSIDSQGETILCYSCQIEEIYECGLS